MLPETLNKGTRPLKGIDLPRTVQEGARKCPSRTGTKDPRMGRGFLATTMRGTKLGPTVLGHLLASFNTSPVQQWASTSNVLVEATA